MKDTGLDEILERFPRKRVLVVGDVMLDEYLCGEVRRISPEAPVPVVELRERRYVPGGAANAAANVAGLHAQVILAGVVGGDEAGSRLLRSLGALGIGPEGIFIDEGRPTTTKTRVIAHNQQVVRIDHEDRRLCSLLLEGKLLRFIDGLSEIDACILSDYAKGWSLRHWHRE